MQNVRLAISRLEAMAAQSGKRATDYPAVVDTESARLSMGVNHFPCVTEKRAAGHGFWKMQQASFVTTSELMRLQGFTDEEMAGMKMVLYPYVMGERIGAGFTKTVVQRLITQCLIAAGRAA